MNLIKFLFAPTLFCLLNFISIAQAKNADLSVKNDINRKLTSSRTGRTKIIKHNNPIILQKGEVLRVKVSEDPDEISTVRVHSSLGRLVKEFMQANQEISMKTDNLLPGIYMLIIKRENYREIRKVLLTE